MLYLDIGRGRCLREGPTAIARFYLSNARVRHRNLTCQQDLRKLGKIDLTSRFSTL